MNNYQKHAIAEFTAAGWMNEDGTYKDDMQAAMCGHVLKLLDVFSEEGHSGTSAPYAVDLFSKLASFKPIVPLTGEASEWNLVGVQDGQPLYQNKRCSRVFMQGQEAYDIDGVVFWEWFTTSDGEKIKSHFTSADSRVPVTFPYTPKTEYRERGATP